MEGVISPFLFPFFCPVLIECNRVFAPPNASWVAKFHLEFFSSLHTAFFLYLNPSADTLAYFDFCELTIQSRIDGRSLISAVMNSSVTTNRKSQGTAWKWLIL